MVRFKLFGIPIEIQPFFWITLAIFGGALRASTSDALLQVCLFILAGFLSILVHELGHALTGKAFGAPTAITLQAFGGFASFPPNAFSRGQDIIVTAAGPAIQIALGGLFFFIARFYKAPSEAITVFIYYVFIISIFWALINLIPVIPLDGGRLMAAILGPSREAISLKISIVAAIIGGIVMFKIIGSFIFPIFLGMMAYQNWQALQQHRR